MSFANNYSVGYDEIPMLVIQKARLCLTKPLVHVANSSFISEICSNK